MSEWNFIHRWYMPFAWVMGVIVVTVPLAMYFQHDMTMHPGSELGLAYGDSWVVRDEYLATIVPYLLGLGCAYWLFSSDGSTRWAALWALLVAFARIIGPIVLASMSDAEIPGGQHYIDWQTFRILVWFQDFQMLALCVMVWAAFARFVGESGGAPAAVHAEAY